MGEHYKLPLLQWLVQKQRLLGAVSALASLAVVILSSLLKLPMAAAIGIFGTLIVIIIVTMIATRRHWSFRRAASVALSACAIVAIAVFVSLSSRGFSGPDSGSNMLVAIPDFGGRSDISSSLVNEIALQLKSLVPDSLDLSVIRLRDTISDERDGDVRARDCGGRYHADLVIWGYVSDTDPTTLRVHFQPTGRLLAAIEDYRFGISMLSLLEDVTSLEPLTIAQNPELHKQLALYARHVARVLLAIKYLSEGLSREALEVCAESGSLTDSTGFGTAVAVSFLLRAYALADLGDVDSALIYSAKASEAQHVHDAAVAQVGALRLFLGDVEAGLNCIDSVIKSSPRKASMWNARAAAYYFMGCYKQAIAASDSGLELGADTVRACYMKALAYAEMGALSEARQAADIGARREFNSLGVAVLANLVLSRLEDERAASVAYKALHLGNDNPSSWYSRAQCFSRIGNTAEAMNCIKHGLKKEHTTPWDWISRANAIAPYFACDSVLTCFDSALAYNPELSNAWFMRALYLYRIRNLPEALSSVQSALSISPYNSTYRLLRAELLDGLSRESEALSELNDLIIFSPRFCRADSLRAVIAIESAEGLSGVSGSPY